MKVVEGSNAGSIIDMEVGNDGVKMIFFQVSSRLGVGSDLKARETRIEQSISEGSLGSELKTEYWFCISSSICDRPRFQNLLRIC